MGWQSNFKATGGQACLRGLCQGIPRRRGERQPKLVIDLLVESDAPSIQDAKMTMHPDRAMLAILGSARASSMRKHLRAWSRIRFYNKVNFGKPWPMLPSQIVDYLWQLFDQGCKKTQPQTAVDSLNFMEEKAGVDSAARLGRSDIVVNTVKYMTSLLAQGAPEVRKAPMIFVCMLPSMEAFVMDESKPLYARALAWLC